MRRSERDGLVAVIAVVALILTGLFLWGAIPELLGTEDWP